MNDKARALKRAIDAQYEVEVRPAGVVEIGEWQPKTMTPELPGLPLAPTVDTSPQALLNYSAPTPWTVRAAKRGGKHHIMDAAGREICTVLTGEVDALLIAQAVNAYQEMLDNAAASDDILAAQRAEIFRLQGRK